VCDAQVGAGATGAQDESAATGAREFRSKQMLDGTLGGGDF
jgi:hypothetical protein